MKITIAKAAKEIKETKEIMNADFFTAIYTWGIESNEQPNETEINELYARVEG